MKKSIILILISLFFIGCSDDLERLPLNSIGEPEFWQTADDATLGINGVYHVLADNAMYRNFIRQSDAISNNAYSQFSFNYFLEISEGIGYDTSSYWPNAFWSKAYEGIVRANEVIINVPEIDMDEDLKNRILGEAHFLRSLFYFHLTNLYGDVPLVLTQQTIPESLVPRDSKSTVVEQIIKDLDFATDNLPSTYSASELGRVTSAAAYALKSRVYLYNNAYPEAISAANTVISMGYDLLPTESFSNQFLPELENNDTESIFEVQFLGSTGTSGVGSDFNSKSGALPNFSDTYSPVQNFVDAFESGDIRLAATVLQPGEVFAGVPYDPVSSPTGFSVKKSVIPDEAITGDGGANFVVIRFAEILLNLAEAENESVGPDSVVYNAINRIRNRAGLADLPEGLSQEEMRTAIKQERRLELAFEGHHYFDLLRYGADDLEAAMNSVTSVPGHDRVYNDRLLLFPVPQAQINIDENLLPQNPNW